MPHKPRKSSAIDAAGISDRLRRFVNRHYENRAAMERDAAVAHSTAAGWFTSTPVVPDTVSLIALARKKHLNLNYLLLGEGEELRGIDVNQPLWSRLRAALVAEVVSATGASPRSVEAAMPNPDDLFHGLVADALAEWTRVKKPESVRLPRTIGDAIKDDLDGTRSNR